MVIVERPYTYKIKFEGWFEVTDAKHNTSVKPFKTEVLFGCNCSLNTNNMDCLMAIDLFYKPIVETLIACTTKVLKLRSGIEKRWFGLVKRPTKDTQFITALQIEKYTKVEEISTEEYMSKGWTAVSKNRCHYKEVLVSETYDLWCDHIIEGIDIGKQYKKGQHVAQRSKNPVGFKEAWEKYLADCKNNRPKR